MVDLIKSLATGFVMGGVFAFFKLPMPAPSAFAGIMGIVGIYLGFIAVQKIKG